MKRLFFWLMLCTIFVSFDKDVSRVLIFIKEDSPQMEYMLTNEVGRMTEILKQAGFEVVTASISGETIKVGTLTFKPDLMFEKVNPDDYAGFIFPCMVSDLAGSTVVTFAKEVAGKGKPIAAQAGGVVILAKAGLLNGKKYALGADGGNDPDFKGGIYSGTGVVQDGNLITSGVCPWIAKESGMADGTERLTKTLIDLINGKAPSASATMVKSEQKTNQELLMESLARARSLSGEGKTEEASKIYTGIMESNPGDKEAVKGWLMVNMKRSPTAEEEAIGQLEELGKLYPDNTAITFWKMFLQMENKHLDDALKSADRLTVIQPDSAINWLGKGQILESMNRFDEALSAYEKATSLDSKNSDAWQNKAGLLAKTGKLDEAIDSYTKAIQLNPPGIAIFLYNRGCAYCRKGDKVNAMADLTKAISMNPQFKSYAQGDEDYKSLWDSEDFKKLTSQ